LETKIVINKSNKIIISAFSIIFTQNLSVLMRESKTAVGMKKQNLFCVAKKSYD